MTTPRFSLRRCAAASLFTLLLLGGVGCASRPYQKAEVASDSLATAANEVKLTRTQILETTSTLDALLNHTSEKPDAALTRFRASLANLDRSATQLQQRAQAMEAQGQSYFNTWSQQLNQIQNDQMRASSEARQRELSADFANLQQRYQNARRDLTPLLSNLRDIQTLVAADLTPTGITRAREFLPKIQTDATTARAALDGLEESFRILSLKLKPAAAAPVGA